jgi:DNA replication protein DnaD
VSIPKEVEDIIRELEQFDAERDRVAQAISEANAGNKLGWRYPHDLLVPADIKRSYLTGPAH